MTPSPSLPRAASSSAPRWLSLRNIALGVALAVAAAAAWAGVSWWFARKAAQAAEIYADAVAQLGTADAATADSGARAAAAARLETLLAQHPSAPITAEAAYELGNLRYVERDWPAARAAYEIALAKTRSPTLQAMARLGLAYAWEAEKEFAQAVEVFRAALTGRAPNDFLYEELMLGLGRVHELAGHKDKAVETYRRLLREAPQSLRADDIRRRLVALGAAGDVE